MAAGDPGSDGSGVGLDLVSVARLRRVLARTPAFADHFHPRERAEANAAPDPPRHLAVCFAVKEAALKAHGRGIFDGVPLSALAFAPATSALHLEPAAAALLGPARHHVTFAASGDFVWALVLAHRTATGLDRPPGG